MAHEILFLEPRDHELMAGVLEVLAQAFDEESAPDHAKRPSANHLRRLLGQMHVIALAARSDGAVVGGLVAYVLDKFDQEQPEVYLYDLAVAQSHRRQGIATALIDRLRGIARKRGAQGIYVQADRGDAPAIALYGTLGEGADVLHFEIRP